MINENELRGIRGQLLTALLQLDAAFNAETPARAFEILEAASINIRYGWENSDRLLRELK